MIITNSATPWSTVCYYHSYLIRTSPLTVVTFTSALYPSSSLYKFWTLPDTECADKFTFLRFASSNNTFPLTLENLALISPVALIWQLILPLIVSKEALLKVACVSIFPDVVSASIVRAETSSSILTLADIL